MPENTGILFKVERALPQLPSAKDTNEVLQPSEDTRRKAMARLEYEAERRGQPIPTIPAEGPVVFENSNCRSAQATGSMG